MRISRIAIAVLTLSMAAPYAQTPPPPPDRPHMERGNRVFIQNTVGRGPIGKWWQNSETAKKLQLSDNQIAQLDQIFFEHKMKLIDYGADMEKQDLKLQNLLDADVPDEGQINAQVDQTLGARGKLEREYTTMNLDLRRVLSPEQWRQLKAIRGPGPGDHFMYFQKKIETGGQTSKPVTMPFPPIAGEGEPFLPPPDETF
jgi:Spy/CpxP family protein refolding chaperone